MDTTRRRFLHLLLALAVLLAVAAPTSALAASGKPWPAKEVRSFLQGCLGSGGSSGICGCVATELQKTTTIAIVKRAGTSLAVRATVIKRETAAARICLIKGFR